MRKLKNNELQRISVKDFNSAKKTPIIIVLDNIRSAMNVGSVFRTADAFIIEKIYLCGITACPPNKEILKTAIGANETVAWEYVKETTDIITKLKSENIFLMGDFNFNLDGNKNDWPEINIFNNYRKLFDDSFIKSGQEYGLTEDTYITPTGI